MAQHQDVRPHLPGRVVHRLHAPGRLLQRQRRLGPDAALGRQPHVGNQHVGAGLRHRYGLVVVEHVGARQEAKLARLADHVHFQAVAHLRLFQSLAKRAVDQADGRKILHPAEAHGLDLAQEALHDAKRVGAADAGQDRRALDDRQHLAGHVHYDLVGVAVGHHAAEAAAAGHAEAAGVVDDEEVDAAGLGALGADAGAGAAADDRLAGGDLGTQALEAFVAGELAHAGGSSSSRARKPASPICPVPMLA